VFEIVREVHRGHTALSEFALDAVAAAQCGREARGNSACFTSRAVVSHHGHTETSVCVKSLPTNSSGSPLSTESA